MSELRFAEPQWAHALWVLVVFIGSLFFMERRGAGALDRLVAPALRDRLVARPATWRRRLRILLLGAAGAFAIVALMRPQWGLHHVVTPRVGAEIMICLDVSRSMLAEDAAPNRLERAKAEVADLLAFLDGDQVGLIAFAGRASVLSPLTPDFGFLRLVLDGAGVQSVTRGGTQIGAAIAKAVDGFGPERGASRAILLITDGEDHGSFPRDAAAAAAEAGIRILAIGFGDEAGSEIWVTDAESGAREKLRDGEGRPVHSRLDGQLLRELALATEGAYVPAGTGVLDLESIYREHFARLTRGELDPRGRTVRDEGYQWAVLLALVTLIASVGVSAGRAAPAGRAGLTLPRASAILISLALGSGAPQAQELGAPPEVAAPEDAGAREEVAAPEDAAEPEDPRDLYNRGVELLATADPDEAERWFRRARREARADGVLRVHASHNLGWTLVRRAERIQSDQPEEALGLLYEAADWFRDAVQQRPDDADSRHDLEITLHRALLLADQLAQGAEELEQSLAALAERQRGVVANSAALLAQLAPPGAEGRLRSQFRAAAAGQRTVLADADRLAAETGEERDALEAREEPGPEDQMAAAQLDNVLYRLHRARERMGQARRQLRQRQANRAYRRASAALTELKRALDQLRDPVALLDTLIRDATGVAQSTSLLGASQAGIRAPDDFAIEAPTWLTAEGLGEDQQAVAERIEELRLRMQAGLERELPAQADPSAARLYRATREAAPFMLEGSMRLGQATQALARSELRRASGAQLAGIAALHEARERFLDLRALIEAIHGDEVRIAEIAGGSTEGGGAAREEYRPGLQAAQRKNLLRSERLAALIRERATTLDPAPGPQPGEAALQRRRLDAATALLARAYSDMRDVEAWLGRGRVARWPRVRGSAASAVQHLEGLRRLFFSIVEHLEDVAQRQLDLLDRTRDVSVLGAADSPTRAARELGPLVPSQRELASRAAELASALEEQSRQPAAPGGEAAPEETSRRLRQAGEHVLRAGSEMTGAASGMQSDPADLDATQGRQQTALGELAAALELLVPPEQRGAGDDAEQPEPSGQRDEVSSGEDGESLDPAQLLQSVLDREAQRRRERGQRPAGAYETVEKDW